MTKVLIFDSGVGGLSIAQGIIESVPHVQLIFASDNEAYPYGTKTTDELIPRVSIVINGLMEKIEPDILVVACNTASTVVLPFLRKQLDIPVVGVVPAIKPASKLTNTEHIGVLATPATIQRQYTLDLIDSFANDKQVSLLGSSELVEIVEQKLHKGFIDVSQLKHIVEPWLSDDNQIDTIVLACTHFPLVGSELDEVFIQSGRHINWVDSSDGIAKRVAFLIKENGLKKTSSSFKNRACFTKELKPTTVFIDALEVIQIFDIEWVSI